MVELVGTIGGSLALVVSVGLAISLPIRDVGYNAVNLFTVILASFAGVLAIRGSRREDGSGLGWGSLLLFLAMVPTVFGWVVLLYLPALVAVVTAVVAFITAPSTSDLSRFGGPSRYRK